MRIWKTAKPADIGVRFTQVLQVQVVVSWLMPLHNVPVNREILYVVDKRAAGHCFSTREYFSDLKN